MNQHKKLFPILTTKERENQPNILFVSRVYDSELIQYKIIDVLTQKVIENHHEGIELEDFLDKFCFDNVKAAIFNISDPDYEYSVSYLDIRTRQKAAAKLQSMKVPYLFVNNTIFTAMNVLISSNAVFKIDETILIITMHSERYHVIELLREKRGYQVIHKREIKCTSDDTNFKELRSQILGTNEPSKIVIKAPVPTYMPSKLMDKLTKNILTSESLIICVENQVFYEKMHEAIAKVVCVITRNMYDPSFTTFRILPFSQACYWVIEEQNVDELKDILIFGQKYDILPHQFTTTISRTSEPFTIICYDETTNECYFLQTVKFEPYQNAIYDKMMITLFVDKNDIPYLYHKSLTEGELMHTSLQLPVVGFFRNTTYLRISDKQIQRDPIFLESWNGRFGQQTFLSFEEKKPKLITEMNEKCNVKSVIKVQDIIKVMSMPSDFILIDTSWNFGITDDPENPVLISFDNFDGKFSTASPAFLIALVLKELLKIFRKETKVKVEQIGLYLIGKRIYEPRIRGDFNEEEAERIENGFEEACKLLKIDYFSTADIGKTGLMSPRSKAKGISEILAEMKKEKDNFLFKL